MKKGLILVMVLTLAMTAGAMNRPVINPDDISLKAGPTDPGEAVAIAWLEAYVYPKEVSNAGTVSLGIRTTSKVDAVIAAFDFCREKVPLSSNDGLNWSGVRKLAEDASPGLHVVRYSLVTNKGQVQRTVDFFVTPDEDSAALSNEIHQIQNWPLTVMASCSALSGNRTRVLKPGQKLTAISKLPWYEVVFEDGAQGWVSAAAVREPLEDFHHLGYEAYSNGDFRTAIDYYRKALAIDPTYVKAHLWLAKSYGSVGAMDAAYRSIMEAIRLDERDIDCRVFANSLALRYYNLASRKFGSGDYHGAVADYQKVVALKPNSANSLVELGKCYSKLGLPESARSAWRSALAVAPDNEEIYSLLQVKPGQVIIASAPVPPAVKKPAVARRAVRQPAAVKPPRKLPAFLREDSVGIVKQASTGKGTKIETALGSVIAMTKSLGTPVIVKGWQTRKKGDDYMVQFLCEQGEGILEAFEWSVDVDSKRVEASNDNARVLMDRW